MALPEFLPIISREVRNHSQKPTVIIPANLIEKVDLFNSRRERNFLWFKKPAPLLLFTPLDEYLLLHA